MAWALDVKRVACVFVAFSVWFQWKAGICGHTHTKVQPRFGGMLTLGVTFGGLNDFHTHAAQVCLGTERNPTHVFGGKRSCTLGRAAGNFGQAGSERGGTSKPLGSKPG